MAEILGCTAGTVRSQIHRALATLRTRLGVAEEVGHS
ncbi:MAG: sigma factor-like helix-turn-helix DNA-binding protein [Nocardioidaceae bacterium]